MPGLDPQKLWLASIPIARAVEEDGARVIYGVASTGNRDRFGTKLDQASVGRAARRYDKRNGKIFYNHGWAVAIGRSGGINVRDDGLHVKGLIGRGYPVPVSMPGSPFASPVLMGVDDIWSMIHQEMASSYSLAWHSEDPPDKDGNLTVDDLLEVSVVSIPGNPDAEFTVTRALDSMLWRAAQRIEPAAATTWLLDDPTDQPGAEEEAGQSSDDYAAVMEELDQCRKLRLMKS